MRVSPFAPAGLSRGGLTIIAAALGRDNRRALLAALSCLLALAAHPARAEGRQDRRPLPPRELVGRERELEFAVSRSSEPEGIALRARFETAVPAPLEEVLATLRDFEGSPAVFSRIEAVLVLSREGDAVVTEQRTVIKALGLRFRSVATFRSTLERSCPGEARCGFEAIGSDGSLISTRGSWFLRDESDGEGSLTYISYELESCVPPTLPGQEFVMRTFGSGDLARTLRELERAVLRRIRGAGSG